jgi:hypothetical protein
MMGTIPTGGAPNQYISIAATSTGMASCIWTGAAASTLATNFTLNGISNAMIYSVKAACMA